ncbi:DUF433 domain-containing protein [Nocardia sp. NPDC058666]|uniref:DUF433 domain-containing protein n=1 Tax=Nocardia sp. NPDC058666 TaxID=3346587 RepID=UPI00365372A7
MLLAPTNRAPPGQRPLPAAIAGSDLIAEATMVPMSRLDRITSDPQICHGQPVVRGLRIPVQNILEMMASGMSAEEILDDYR